MDTHINNIKIIDIRTQCFGNGLKEAQENLNTFPSQKVIIIYSIDRPYNHEEIIETYKKGIDFLPISKRYDNHSKDDPLIMQQIDKLLESREYSIESDNHTVAPEIDKEAAKMIQESYKYMVPMTHEQQKEFLAEFYRGET